MLPASNKFTILLLDCITVAQMLLNLLKALRYSASF